MLGQTVASNLAAIQAQPALLAGTTVFQNGLASTLWRGIKNVGTGVLIEELFSTMHGWWTGRPLSDSEKQDMVRKLRKDGIDPAKHINDLTAEELKKLAADAAPSDASPREVQAIIDALTGAAKTHPALHAELSATNAAIEESTLMQRRKLLDSLTKAWTRTRLSPVQLATIAQVTQLLLQADPVILQDVMLELTGNKSI